MPVPFAESGTKNAVPIPSQIGVTPGAASFTTGFPPLTFTPIAAGGVPPFGADFNGVLNAITQALRWTNAGGQYVYDVDFATAIGGYPKGALLQRSTLDGFWMNTVDNNTTDPDTGGAGWVDPLSGRLLNIQTFTVSGTYTPTAGTRSVVVEVIGGGGGSGGVPNTTSGQFVSSGGGGGGSYAKSRITSGFSGQTVTIGAGGAAGNSTTAGGDGGATSFGALLSAPGGGGGSAGAVTSTPPHISPPGTPGTLPTLGNVLNLAGGVGSNGYSFVGGGLGGSGGPAGNGFAGPRGMGTGNPGSPGVNPGSGAGGTQNQGVQGGHGGAAGANGICIIHEYA
jgi:hypothetical protein